MLEFGALAKRLQPKWLVWESWKTCHELQQAEITRLQSIIAEQAERLNQCEKLAQSVMLDIGVSNG